MLKSIYDFKGYDMLVKGILLKQLNKVYLEKDKELFSGIGPL